MGGGGVVPPGLSAAGRVAYAAVAVCGMRHEVFRQGFAFWPGDHSLAASEAVCGWFWLGFAVPDGWQCGGACDGGEVPGGRLVAVADNSGLDDVCGWGLPVAVDGVPGGHGFVCAVSEEGAVHAEGRAVFCVWVVGV